MLLIIISIFLVGLVGCSTTHTVETKSNVEEKRIVNFVALAHQYEDLMKNFPASEKLTSCVEINFKSDRRLRRNQRNLYLNNPQVAIPNYNGIYLLLENPVSNGSEWLVINCRSGRLETIVPTVEDILFDAESRVIVVNSEDPKLLEWSNKKWQTAQLNGL